ncbi:MAG: autotransporter-associated beta strand repeat-containing protein [Parachlamydiales bacterium]|jgi:autotransporter-associated beta strand protein
MSAFKKKIFILLFFPFFIFSVDYEWIAGSGNWNTASNWYPATVPNSSNADVYFPPGAAKTITLDISPKVNSMTVTSGSNYTFSPSTSFIHFQGAGASLPNGTSSTIFNCSFSLDSSTVFICTNAMNIPTQISGTGSLTLQGFGLFNLSGSNTYTGQTILNFANLITSANNTLPASTSLVFLNSFPNPTFALNNFNQNIGSLSGSVGTITLGSATLTTGNDNTNTTFSGVISGNGGLTKVGSGTFTISGANTYLGETLISDGILKTDIANALSASSAVINNSTFNLNNFNQRIGSLAGSGSINLGTLSGSTLTTGNNNSSTIFSGTISQTGGLIKEGTGKFTLSGNNAYSGNTLINNGNLAILGSLTSNIITIQPSGILSGNGTVTGSITSNGVIRPGASVGTLSVAGPVTLNSGSVYQVEFNTTSSDLLDVTGIVTIQVGANVELIPDFSVGAYQPFQRYTIIQSGGGVFGTFDNIITAFPAFIGELSYDNPNTVDLIVNIVPFTALVRNGNPGAVAEYFDFLSTQIEGSDLDDVIESLQFLSIEEMREAFDQLHPAIFKGLSLVSESNVASVRSLINQRIAEIYNPNCLGKCFGCQKYSFWAAPFYDNYTQKNIHGLRGFDSNIGGFSLGFDNRICRNNYLGIRIRLVVKLISTAII